MSKKKSRVVYLNVNGSRSITHSHYTEEEFRDRFPLWEFVQLMEPDQGEGVRWHPHDEVIRAWLDGEKIQRRFESDEPWQDVEPPANDCFSGFFMPTTEYRVKPKEEEYRWVCLENGRYWVTPQKWTRSELEKDLTNSAIIHAVTEG